MPITDEQRAIVNRLREHLRGMMPDDLRKEVQQALDEHKERVAEEEKSGVIKWAERQLARFQGSDPETK
jgi:hypothetical protein